MLFSLKITFCINWLVFLIRLLFLSSLIILISIRIIHSHITLKSNLKLINICILWRSRIAISFIQLLKSWFTQIKIFIKITYKVCQNEFEFKKIIFSNLKFPKIINYSIHVFIHVSELCHCSIQSLCYHIKI